MNQKKDQQVIDKQIINSQKSHPSFQMALVKSLQNIQLQFHIRTRQHC